MRTCTLALAILLLLPLTGASAQGATARWLLIRIANQAHANAVAADHAGKHADAKTWRAWETLYRKNSAQPNARMMSASQLAQGAVQEYVKEADNARVQHQFVAYRFLLSQCSFWRRVSQQLSQGQVPNVMLPDALLRKVPGLAGTPWAPKSTQQASASDCAKIRHHVLLCRAQLSQLQREQATGLYGDQDQEILVREMQCHRWEEALLAYCPEN